MTNDKQLDVYSDDSIHWYKEAIPGDRYAIIERQLAEAQLKMHKQETLIHNLREYIKDQDELIAHFLKIHTNWPKEYIND
ncbi:MAG: hypothetical protein IPL34_20365 [Thiofilum sp.]|uniref:hypothetical protein n=1 Tax=Thiofilum sp. TaxID=2212733 RepID=UPI0025E507A8|nr:hypothetical protein [Thiofilum sp.]MBK8455637.1 hypothetical protein [Thiofilum sp.]